METGAYFRTSPDAKEVICLDCAASESGNLIEIPAAEHTEEPLFCEDCGKVI